MGRDSRVAWREGLFLRPQHFQQQERHFDALARSLAGAVRPYPWGLQSIAISESHASRGQFALEKASGVMPDGTPFSIPADMPPPPPLDVPADTRDAIVSLTLQSRQVGTIEFIERERARSDVRMLVGEEDVHDAFSAERSSEPIEIATPNLNYGLSREQTEGRVCLPLARIQEVLNKQVVFDQRHIPPLLDIRGSVRLTGFLRDILGRLGQRVDELALRAVEATDGGSETFANFLLLQSLNRLLPVLRISTLCPSCIPSGSTRRSRWRESWRRWCAPTTAGRRSSPTTITRTCRRPSRWPMRPCRPSSRRCSSSSAGRLVEARAGPARDGRDHQDHALFSTCNFYLAVAARVPQEELRARFPCHREDRLGA